MSKSPNFGIFFIYIFEIPFGLYIYKSDYIFYIYYHKKMKFLVIPIILFVIRICWGYFAGKVETPNYKIISTYEQIQVREIPSSIYATVSVKWPETQAPNIAFGILAWYIFWWNISRKNISMTAPVVSQKESEPIAMTAPVVSTKSDNWNYNVSFLMPSFYTIDTLPIPNDKRIIISQKLSQKVAVITFDWYTTQPNIDKYRNKLLELCKKFEISVTGSTVVAQYNDPRTPRFMRKNEIRIEIK